MFKYILLGSLLVHTLWAKPVEHHVEAAPHVVIVTPQAQLSLDTLVHGTPIIHHTPYVRYIAPHEESIVYVPASTIPQHVHHQSISRSSDSVHVKQLNDQEYVFNNYMYPQRPNLLAPIPAYNDIPISTLEKFALHQKQKIELLEQELQRLNDEQAQQGSTLIKLETPLGGATVTSNLLNAAAPAINLMPNLISPIIKQKSVVEPYHQYVVEQPRHVVEQPHHVVEYIPVVVNPVPITPTVKGRRSVLPQAQEDVKVVAVEDNKPVQLEQALPIIPKFSSDINSAQQQVVANAEKAKKEIEPQVHEQASRSLEADKQNDDQKSEGLVEDKESVATEKPSEVLLENYGISLDRTVLNGGK